MKSIGTIIFKVGMIQFPLSLTTFADYNESGFKQVCKYCESNIHYKKWCDKCNKEIKAQDIKKALLISKDIKIIFDKDLLTGIQEKHKECKIIKVIKNEEVKENINLIRQKTYYCVPKKKFEEVYFIMKEALKQAGLKIFVKFTLRSRSKIGLLEAVNNQLLLSQILYPELIREEPQIKEKEINENDIKNAVRFFEKMMETTKEVNFRDIKDEYKKEVFEVIKEQKPIEAKKIESSFSQTLAKIVEGDK